MYISKLKNIFIILFLFFFIYSIFLFCQNNTNKYSGNSWGTLYYSLKESDIYINFYGNETVYRIEEKTVLMCDGSNDHSTNDRIFCWYLFDIKKQPISGWMNKNVLNIYKE